MEYLDLENDVLLPIQDLCRERFGKRVSPTTIWRWVRKGSRGNKLEAVLICGRWHTSSEAFAAFLDRHSNADVVPEPHSRGRKPAVNDITDEQLRALGLL
jgi:hypothetical protein